ncbi:MAG: hypothetical protein WD960_16185 [Gemmatimonadota bacterium]
MTTLAVVNAERGIGPSNLVLPGVLSLLMGAIAWLIAGFVVRENSGRAVLATVVALFVLMGGWLISAIPLDAAYDPAVTLSLILGVLATAVALHRGIVVVAWPFVRFMIVACVILLALQLPQMGGLLWAFGAGQRAEVEIAPTKPSTGHPNIYFFLLDSYTGPRTLRSQYGFDLEPFNEALEELGFEVAEQSHANFPQTFIGLPAMLDLDYPTEILESQPQGSTDRSDLYHLMHYNTTIEAVKSRGYRVVFYRSSYVPLRSSPSADLHVPRHGITDFELAWLSQTIIASLISQRCVVLPCPERTGPTFAAESAQHHLDKFASITSQADSTAPTFHYIHIMLPHEPFVFTSDCTARPEPHWTSLQDETAPEVRAGMYVEQVECLNQLILRTVRRIQETSVHPPVIILQSDHGYAHLPDARPIPLRTATQDQVADRLDVFAAYHVPFASDSITYPGITPVNALRRVFSEVFGLDLAPIPDRSYWSSFQNPYDFTLIECPAEGRATPC